jgi:serine/threonine protein kinase
MLEPGKKIGSYVLVRKLGAGGFGEVWQAEKHTKLSVNNFALKFFRPKEEDKLTLEKEKREIGIWQKVSGMPNIIGIIEADEFEEYIYVVSEYADGGSLEKRMLANVGRPFPVEEAITIVLETLSGLSSLHQMSFVHRDVKPANILIRRGVYCLADFGISREMKAHSKSTQTAGTYEYMSPESFENRPVTVHSDIWAVGVIMQQLLTGSAPFPQKEIPSLIYAILNRDPEEMPQNIPAGLREIVKKALEKNPQNRFNSAAEMINALKYQQMMLGKPEWNTSNSQQTVAWGNNAQTEQYKTGQNVNQPFVVPMRPTGEPQNAQNTGNIQQSHNFAANNVSMETPKKSKRPLLFAALGGAAFLLLLVVAAVGAFVYKNPNLFTKKAANETVSNTSTNANVQTAEQIPRPRKTLKPAQR